MGKGQGAVGAGGIQTGDAPKEVKRGRQEGYQRRGQKALGAQTGGSSEIVTSRRRKLAAEEDS